MTIISLIRHFLENTMITCISKNRTYMKMALKKVPGVSDSKLAQLTNNH
jgi:hypothetical protein